MGNFITARWSTRFGINRMILAGAVVSLAGSLAQVALIKFISAGAVAALFLSQSVISLGSGLLLPNSVAGAVSVRPQAAGTASGITGFLQMGLGAVVAQLIAHMLGGANSALPLVLMVLGFGIATLVAFLALVRGT
jgi:MFS transporter, DHA1 family, multidrug resistance protein